GVQRSPRADAHPASGGGGGGWTAPDAGGGAPRCRRRRLQRGAGRGGKDGRAARPPLGAADRRRARGDGGPDVPPRLLGLGARRRDLRPPALGAAPAPPRRGRAPSAAGGARGPLSDGTWIPIG